MTTTTLNLKGLNHVLKQRGIPEAEIAHAAGAVIRAFDNPDFILVITDESGLDVPALGAPALLGLDNLSRDYELQEVTTVQLPAPYQDHIRSAYDFLRGYQQAQP